MKKGIHPVYRESVVHGACGIVLRPGRPSEILMSYLCQLPSLFYWDAENRGH